MFYLYFIQLLNLISLPGVAASEALRLLGSAGSGMLTDSLPEAALGRESSDSKLVFFFPRLLSTLFIVVWSVERLAS